MSNPLARYQKLGYKESLEKIHRYPLACKELGFILRAAYAEFPKNLQALIVQDTITAFRLLPGFVFFWFVFYLCKFFTPNDNSMELYCFKIENRVLDMVGVQVIKWDSWINGLCFYYKFFNKGLKFCKIRKITVFQPVIMVNH